MAEQLTTLSVHSITERLYGVRTYTQPRLISLAPGDTDAQSEVIRQDTTRLAVFFQNISAGGQMFVQVGNPTILTTGGNPTGIRLNPRQIAAFTVYEDLGISGESFTLWNISSTTQLVYVYETIAAPQVTGGF